MPPKTRSKTPRFASKGARKLWRTVANRYELLAHHAALLETACLALDRIEQAREAVARDGVTVANRFGHPVEHPAAKIERRYMNTFRQLMAEIGFDN
jgi:P27 family predicted phage terminase small subunit